MPVTPMIAGSVLRFTARRSRWRAIIAAESIRTARRRLLLGAARFAATAWCRDKVLEPQRQVNISIDISRVIGIALNLIVVSKLLAGGNIADRLA